MIIHPMSNVLGGGPYDDVVRVRVEQHILYLSCGVCQGSVRTVANCEIHDQIQNLTNRGNNGQYQ